MRVFTATILLVATGLLPTTGPAQADSYKQALELANVIAGEKFCDLSYDPAAIEAWIEKHVAADDMSFASNLRVYMFGQEEDQKTMGASEKTAHCKQIARVAKANGFTK